MKRIRITHRTEYHYTEPGGAGGAGALPLAQLSLRRAALHAWLSDLYRPGQIVDTAELLNRLSTRIHGALRYAARDDHGVQLPHVTLATGTGSCRDHAVLMMEAARHWGFDPTNNKLAGSEHISVAVAREREKAAPLSGTWTGPAGAFERLAVSVQVVAL
jgi:hypothetical protein